MSTMPQGSMGARMHEFNDEMLYDPLQGETTEEQLAHIRSQGHTPNAQHSFEPPPSEEMGFARHPTVDSTRGAIDNNDLFDLPRMDSGLSNTSLDLPFDPDNTPLPYDPAAFAANADQLQSPMEPPSRMSSGLATLSGDSHLMSPTLTNETADPVSPIGSHHDQPYKLLGGGDMSRDSSLDTVNPSAYTYLRTTPAPTRSSAMTSPDPTSELPLASPVVRVVNAHGEDASHSVHTPPTTGKRTHDQTQSHFLHPGRANPELDDDMYDDSSMYNAPGSVNEVSTPGTRTGVSPGLRSSGDVIPSINEQTQERKVGERNNEVTSWLLMRDAGPGTYLDPNAAIPGLRPRIRSKSTSKNLQQLRTDAFHSTQGRRDAQERSTPGPDVLIDEDSDGENGDSDSGSYAESAPASVDGAAEEEEEQAHLAFGHLDLPEKPLEASPWVDPIYLPSRLGDRTQPQTSNAAIMRWKMRNLDSDIETASRVATWGTRRMSDSTLDQVFGSRGLFSRLKLTNSKEKESDDGHETRNSLQEGIDHVKQKYRAFRSNSVNKRKSAEPMRPIERTDTYTRGVSPHSRRSGSDASGHDRRESSSSISNIIQRIPSTRRHTHSRPPTPRIDTAGGRTTPKPPSISHSQGGVSGPSSPSSSAGFKERIKSLIRYKSDDSHGSGDTLASMWRDESGPLVPALTSPRPEDSRQLGEKKAGSEEEEEDDDDAATARPPEDKPEKGVKMPMTPSKDLIIPNFDGFKSNVRDVNPRLEQWLVERLGQEQLRRYKRLVEMKVQHVKAVQMGTCQSGDFCIAKGGQPRYFAPPKSAHKDSVGSADADVPLDDMDEDEQAIAEGTVTEAQFPAGLPMPPVQRLPAEFECPFCFTVKKFTKPSDWSKHVHEDLQPFTCTFKKCSDPKSFKRKADWVRHENERHRQLEWWECTEEGCQHRCYRRDNFVQHLIREHKLPEPVTKPAKQPNKPAVRGPAKSKGRGRSNTTNVNEVPPEEKVLLMVDICRHETSKNAVEERCRFCNNVCNSWKKLTVHLARHMEQLSIPVLDLVKDREVNVDTIISPLEPRPPPQASVSPVEQIGGNAFNAAHAFTSAGNGHLPLVSNIMDPDAFVSLPDTTFGTQQFDHAGWPSWTTSQQATQLAYGSGSTGGAYSNMQQASYGDAANPVTARYMGSTDGGMFMSESGDAQSLYSTASMSNQPIVAPTLHGRNLYAQQSQLQQPQPQQQQQFPQASQWHNMQYGMTPEQGMAYNARAHQAAPQKQNPTQQQQQQQYYSGQWQQ